MRLFIAVEIDRQKLDALGELQKQLRSEADVRGGDVKWVSPQNMHLTLKFLGEIDEGKLSEISAITEKVAASHKSFGLSMQSVGWFGGKSATVLWVGAGAGANELLALQKDLEAQLALAGWPAEDRPFSCHLTIARVKNHKAGLKLAQLAEQYKNFEPGTLSVDSLSVYKSQLTPTGPVYTLLGNYKLK